PCSTALQESRHTCILLEGSSLLHLPRRAFADAAEPCAAGVPAAPSWTARASLEQATSEASTWTSTAPPCGHSRFHPKAQQHRTSGVPSLVPCLDAGWACSETSALRLK